MNNYYDAFEISPVPAPGPGVAAPDLYHGIYGMPMFLTVRTRNLDRALGFWTRGLGFFELFSVPGTMVHLRRWAFQDVLLVVDGDSGSDDDHSPEPGAASLSSAVPGVSPAAPATPAFSGSWSPATVSVACVLDQIDGIAAECRAVSPGSVSAIVDTPWNTRDLHITAPDGVQVVFTAAKPYDPDSAAAKNLAKIGILPPEDNGAGDTGGTGGTGDTGGAGDTVGTVGTGGTGTTGGAGDE